MPPGRTETGLEAPNGMRLVGWHLEPGSRVLGGIYRTDSIARQVAEAEGLRLWPLWVDKEAP